MAEGDTSTIGDVVRKYQLIIKKLLNCPFRGVAGVRIFGEELLAELRQVANEIENQRRKTNWGVIGGSAAGIVGGGMAIAGAALIPFTFGTSIGLIISGTAISVTGSGVSLGFSLDKKFKDKKKLPIIQNALEEFIALQNDLAVAMALISVCETQIKKIKDSPLVDVKLRPRNDMHLAITHLVDEVHTLYNREEDHRNIRGRIQDILRYSRTMSEVLKNILDPIAPLFTTNSSLFEDQLREAEEEPFNMLASCVPRNEGNDLGPHTTPTFHSFVKRYLWANNTADNTTSHLPAGIGVDAAGNLIARGGVAGGRIALRFVNTADNIAQVGGSVLRIARAVSIAGIVLSAVGVVVDIGFLGHAIYDLTREDAEDLSQAFIDLADVMEEIDLISTEH